LYSFSNSKRGNAMRDCGFSDEVCSFKLGSFACWCVSDGGHTYTVESLFANVPREQAEAELRRLGQPADSVTTPYTHLLVDTGEHRVLADMGAGSLFHTTGRLPDNLRAAGIDPALVDIVVITHAHPDHIGGVLDRDGNPAYPNAHYFIGRDEYAFWASEVALEKWPADWVMGIRAALKVMEDRLSLVEREGEIVPGVSVLQAPGHTPGHMVVSFQSRGEELLYVGDSALHTLQLEHTGWLPQPLFWLDPEQAAASQRRVFDYAADAGALVIGQHFIPFPSLGRVVRLGEGWQWQPV
jgi:glyoxylase-like metal-dependent hydrolase (beta-lactamase superfamily II)